MPSSWRFLGYFACWQEQAAENDQANEKKPLSFSLEGEAAMAPSPGEGEEEEEAEGQEQEEEREGGRQQEGQQECTKEVAQQTQAFEANCCQEHGKAEVHHTEGRVSSEAGTAFGEELGSKARVANTFQITESSSKAFFPDHGGPEERAAGGTLVDQEEGGGESSGITFGSTWLDSTSPETECSQIWHVVGGKARHGSRPAQVTSLIYPIASTPLAGDGAKYFALDLDDTAEREQEAKEEDEASQSDIITQFLAEFATEEQEQQEQSDGQRSSDNDSKHDSKNKKKKRRNKKKKAKAKEQEKIVQSNH